MTLRGTEMSVSVGGEEAEIPAPNPLTVIHDPICDTMPPMNC